MRPYLIIIKEFLTQALKSAVVKAALFYLVKWSIISIGGFKAVLAKIVLKDLVFDKVLLPSIQIAFRAGMLRIYKTEGGWKLQRLKKAKVAGEKDKYLDLLTSL